MSTVKQLVGTRISFVFTSASLSTLASSTYVQSSSAYDCTVNSPMDVIIECDFTTTNVPSGNKQVVLFIQESLDGVNYRTGPTTGTTTTREPNLRLLGVIPLTTTSTAEIATFSVVQALGYLPQKFFIVVKNDLGVALTSGTIFTSEISNTIV